MRSELIQKLENTRVDCSTLGNIEHHTVYTPPQKVISLPQTGVGINLHGSADGNKLYGGSIKQFGSNNRLGRLNTYESAMADYYAEQLNLKSKTLK